MPRATINGKNCEFREDVTSPFRDNQTLVLEHKVTAVRIEKL